MSRGRGGLGAGPRLGVTEREVLYIIKRAGRPVFISARSAPRGVSIFKICSGDGSTNILYRGLNYS